MSGARSICYKFPVSFNKKIRVGSGVKYRFPISGFLSSRKNTDRDKPGQYGGKNDNEENDDVEITIDEKGVIEDVILKVKTKQHTSQILE